MALEEKHSSDFTVLIVELRNIEADKIDAFLRSHRLTEDDIEDMGGEKQALWEMIPAKYPTVDELIRVIRATLLK